MFFITVTLRDLSHKLWRRVWHPPSSHKGEQLFVISLSVYQFTSLLLYCFEHSTVITQHIVLTLSHWGLHHTSGQVTAAVVSAPILLYAWAHARVHTHTHTHTHTHGQKSRLPLGVWKHFIESRLRHTHITLSDILHITYHRSYIIYHISYIIYHISYIIYYIS